MYQVAVRRVVLLVPMHAIRPGVTREIKGSTALGIHLRG